MSMTCWPQRGCWKTTPIEKGGIRVSFDWRSETAAAVFVRDGFIWVFFDKPTRVDLGGMRILGADIVRSVKQYPVPQGTLLRLAVPRQYVPSVSRAGTIWILDIIRNSSLKVSHPIEPKVQTRAAGGPRVLLPVAGARGPTGCLIPRSATLSASCPCRSPDTVSRCGAASSI